ncbi:hypothetical protein GGG16DRAFT_127876 [Schizophyllum commune]
MEPEPTGPAVPSAPAGPEAQHSAQPPPQGPPATTNGYYNLPQLTTQNGNVVKSLVRCDLCKKNNTRCDRTLPGCGTCASAMSPCVYTPIPPHAHKGVTRCVTCKRENIRCDRTLPACDQCVDSGIECQYISGRKRGRKNPPPGPEASQSAPISTVSVRSDDLDASGEDDPETEERTILTQPSASTSRAPALPYPSAPQHKPATPAPAQTPQPAPVTSGRYSSHYRDAPTGHPSAPPKARGGPPNTVTGLKRHNYTYIPSSVPRPVIPGAHIHPWMNPAFVALPEVIIAGLARVPSVELPDRITFTEHLNRFLDKVIDELRTTVCLGQEEYADTADCLAENRLHDLPEPVREWVQFHHVMSGSDRAGLLLIPREDHFQRSPKLLERLRLIYQCHVDGQTGTAMYRALPPMDLEGLDWLSVFQRLPVKEQIYDILAYAHRGHGSTTLMLMEVQRLGFAGISWPMAQLFCDVCPLCNMQTVTKFRNVSYSVT